MSHQSIELDGVAIIGMSGRFPGAADIAQFWQNLRAGRETITRLSDDELAAAGIPAIVLRHPGYVKAAPLLADIELFDAEFFGFSPGEAQILDPQQRLFLECAWSALEHAGYDPNRYPGAIGVYASTSVSGYMLHNLYPSRDPVQLGRYGLNMSAMQVMFGNDKDYLATRVSFKLNLSGPSVTVQTACSSSLVAVHMACQSLTTRECDMALAGGVSVKVPHIAGYFYEEGSIVSPDGHCRAFDARAQGTVFGSGVGVVVLKRLSAALADGDAIYAVIRGWAINNDGSLKVGYTAPSVDAQARVVEEALAMADVDPATIGYVEAHGTGTALGDPVEVAALTRAFGGGAAVPGSCAIGSVKTNVGHLDSAAGVTGLIKAALALANREIPPTLHFEHPNPQIDFTASPFYVNTVVVDWQRGRSPRRASVNSLGAGGTNAHVVLEEAPSVEASGPSRPWQALMLSARTEAALDRLTAALAVHLRDHPELCLADVAATLQRGRAVFRHRRVVLCRELTDAVASLECLDPQRVMDGTQDGAGRQVAFLFPGQGAQYRLMAHELYLTEPGFRTDVNHCAELLEPHLQLDLRELLYPADHSSVDAKRSTVDNGLLDQTRYTQPALFVVEYALARLWMSWGIRPRAMIGHSIGEYVAACLAGVFSLRDALGLVAARGSMMQQMPPGAMLMVSLAESELQPLLNPRLSLAAVNEPGRCVVAGPVKAVEVLEAELAVQGVACRRLHTSHAFHSAMMEPILEPFAQALARVELRPPAIPFVSNVTGNWITAAEATDPNYWVRHARCTVRFADGLDRLLAGSRDILLEVGPGHTLSTIARRHPATDVGRAIVASIRHPHDGASDVEFLVAALGRLWLAGATVDWNAYHAGASRRRVALPGYPFERKRYWIEPQPSSAPDLATAHAPTEPPAEPAQALAEGGQERHQRPALSVPYVAPRSPIEETLVAIWQDLLGIEPIGVHDNFFDLGGDSVLGVQVAARANETGLRLSPKLLFEHHTVAELALAVDALAPVAADQGPVTGPVPLTPAQHWFFAQNLPAPVDWVVTLLMEVDQQLNAALLEQAVGELLLHHDALRLRFTHDGAAWRQHIAAPDGLVPFTRVDVAALSSDERTAALSIAVTTAPTRLDLAEGPLIHVTLLDGGPHEPSFVLFVLHHLLVDIAAQRILLEDLERAYRQLHRGEPVRLPPKTSSFMQWSEGLTALAHSAELRREAAFWLSAPRRQVVPLPLDARPTGDGASARSLRTITTALDPEETRSLLGEVQRTYKIQLDELLLTVIARQFAGWTGQGQLLVDVDGRGRDVPLNNCDLERTVGWFTTIYPVLLELDSSVPAEAALKSVKEQLRRVPNEGLGYGVLRYVSSDAELAAQLAALPQAEVFFSYLGLIDQPEAASVLFRLSAVTDGPARSVHGALNYPLEIRSFVGSGQLQVDWTYDERLLRHATVDELARGTLVQLQAMIAERTPRPVLTPSDFPAAGLNQDDLDHLIAELSDS